MLDIELTDGFSMEERIVLGRKDLRPNDKVVWFFLWWRGHRAPGTHRVKAATIDGACGIDQRTVHAAMARLCLAGLLSRLDGDDDSVSSPRDDYQVALWRPCRQGREPDDGRQQRLALQCGLPEHIDGAAPRPVAPGGSDDTLGLSIEVRTVWHNRDLSPNDKIVWLLLWRRAGATPGIYRVTSAAITAACRIDPKTARTTMARLRGTSLIDIIEHHGDYRFDLGLPCPQDRKPDDERQQRLPLGDVSNHIAGGLAQDRPPVEEVTGGFAQNRPPVEEVTGGFAQNRPPVEEVTGDFAQNRPPVGHPLAGSRSFRRVYAALGPQDTPTLACVGAAARALDQEQESNLPKYQSLQRTKATKVDTSRVVLEEGRGAESQAAIAGPGGPAEPADEGCGSRAVQPGPVAGPSPLVSAPLVPALTEALDQVGQRTTPAAQKLRLRQEILATVARAGPSPNGKPLSEAIAGKAADLVVYHGLEEEKLREVLGDVIAMHRTGKLRDPPGFFNAKAAALAGRCGVAWCKNGRVRQRE